MIKWLVVYKEWFRNWEITEKQKQHVVHDYKIRLDRLNHMEQATHRDRLTDSWAVWGWWSSSSIIK